MTRSQFAKRAFGLVAQASEASLFQAQSGAMALAEPSAWRSLSTLALPKDASASAFTKSSRCHCGRVACMGNHDGLQTRLLHAHPNPPSDPTTALEYLRQGNERFVNNKPHDAHPTRNLDRVKATAGGQKPFAAFLSCADSRVPVEIIFDQGFGDVFVTRVAGNIVTNEITASLEFGTAVLGSKVLMVLGHSACGAVAATMGGGAVPGVISSLYYGIAPAVQKCNHNHKGGDIDAAIAENVKYQMEQLKVSPVLQGLVKEGKLKIVGGVYDLATGKVNEIA